jgi:hypothetical protein
MAMNRKPTLVTLLSATALLAACGGGGGGDAPPPPAATDAVPDSASASAAGLKKYLADLSAMPVEDKEPLELATFAPKAPDDAEPESVE